MLSMHNVDTYYGNVNVLKEVSITVSDGEAVAIIGANGAGKSTLLNTISGLIPARKGEIRFLKKNITNIYPHKRVEEGIVQVPEGRIIFTSFTVRENLELGMYSCIRRGLEKDEADELFDQVYTLFPILYERKKQSAGNLSGGQQQMLAIARALMAKPKVLLLDEPSLGLAPQLVNTIFDTLKKLKRNGLTILLVEQNTKKALDFADRGYVMELGRIVLEDNTRKLIDNQRIKEIYLGIS